MTFSHFNRRLHLYLALALLPWLCLYGASSVPFAHGQYFDRRDAKRGLPNWTLRYEHPLDVPVPDAADPAAMRLFAKRLLDDGGIRATSYGAYRQSPTQLNVYAYRSGSRRRCCISPIAKRSGRKIAASGGISS